MEKTFCLIADRADYEDGRIKLYIPDKNLFLEIKNAIEEMGGFIEVQFTPNLLQVKLPYFLDLLSSLDTEHNRDELRAELKRTAMERIEKNQLDIQFIEKQPLGRTLANQAPDLIIDIITACVPCFSGVVKEIADKFLKIIRSN